MNRVDKSVPSSYKLIAFGDLKDKVKCMSKVGVINRFGVEV